MMADSIEHVISYWVIFQKFHSPALGGVAVVSHWLPFLFLSVYAGRLADRFDPRRLIQLGMLLFMCVSIAWGVLFLTDTLQMWHAMVLLVVHGFAGVLWSPPSQVLLHDIVPRDQLQSAVRLNATSRYLGLLRGPAIGGGDPAVDGSVARDPLQCAAVSADDPVAVEGALRPEIPQGSSCRRGPFAAWPTSWPRCAASPADRILAVDDAAGGRCLAVHRHRIPGADAGFRAAISATAMRTCRTACCLQPTLPVRSVAGSGAGKPRTVAGQSTHGVHAGDPLVLRARGFRAVDVYPLSMLLLFVAGFVELSFNSMAQTWYSSSAPRRRSAAGSSACFRWRRSACALSAASRSAWSAA